MILNCMSCRKPIPQGLSPNGILMCEKCWEAMAPAERATVTLSHWKTCHESRAADELSKIRQWIERAIEEAEREKLVPPWQRN